jgi:hypothetical protein
MVLAYIDSEKNAYLLSRGIKERCSVDCKVPIGIVGATSEGTTSIEVYNLNGLVVAIEHDIPTLALNGTLAQIEGVKSDLEELTGGTLYIKSD